MKRVRVMADLSNGYNHDSSLSVDHDMRYALLSLSSSGHTYIVHTHIYPSIPLLR
jgi:hypothetical protein